MSEFSLPKADDVDDDAVRRFGVSLFHTFDTGTPLTVKLAFFIRVLPFKDAETTRSFDSVQDIVVLLVLLGMVRRAAVERDPTRLLVLVFPAEGELIIVPVVVVPCVTGLRAPVPVLLLALIFPAAPNACCGSGGGVFLAKVRFELSKKLSSSVSSESEKASFAFCFLLFGRLVLVLRRRRLLVLLDVRMVPLPPVTIDSDSFHSIVDETFFCVEILLVDVEDAKRPFDSESGAAIRFFEFFFKVEDAKRPFDSESSAAIRFFGLLFNAIEVALFFFAVPFDSAGLLFNPIEVDDSLGLTAVELRPATVTIVAVIG